MKRAPLIAKTDGEKVYGMPNFGDYRNKNWELVNDYFVDSSGFGAENETALTAERFFSKVKAGYGYAIIEEGQFQIVVGEFKKVKRSK